MKFKLTDGAHRLRSTGTAFLARHRMNFGRQPSERELVQADFLAGVVDIYSDQIAFGIVIKDNAL